MEKAKLRISFPFGSPKRASQELRTSGLAPATPDRKSAPVVVSSDDIENSPIPVLVRESSRRGSTVSCASDESSKGLVTIRNIEVVQKATAPDTLAYISIAVFQGAEPPLRPSSQVKNLPTIKFPNRFYLKAAGTFSLRFKFVVSEKARGASFYQTQELGSLEIPGLGVKSFSRNMSFEFMKDGAGTGIQLKFDLSIMAAEQLAEEKIDYKGQLTRYVTNPGSEMSYPILCDCILRYRTLTLVSASSKKETVIKIDSSAKAQPLPSKERDYLPGTFMISSPNKPEASLKLTAPSKEEMEKWISVINSSEFDIWC